MKGISPMIATVLIIAFTIAIGGIISVFMTNLTKTTTGEAEKSAAGTSECAGAYIDILYVNTSIPAITVLNPSKNTIYVTAVFDDRGNTTAINTGSGLAMSSGSVAVINTTSVPTSSALKVTLIGFCQNVAGTTNVSITGTCPKGGSCWPK